MIQETDIRERLIAVLEGELSLDDFEDWLVSTSWNMHKDSELAAQDLVGQIEVVLGEYGLGYRTEDALLKSLSDIVEFVHAEIAITD